MKFRKKYSLVEAIRFEGKEDVNRVINWIAQQKTNLEGWLFSDTEITVPTLKGPAKAAPGDWIIRWDRVFDVCPVGIFEQNYETVDMSGDPLRECIGRVVASLADAGVATPEIPLDDLTGVVSAVDRLRNERDLYKRYYDADGNAKSGYSSDEVSLICRARTDAVEYADKARKAIANCYIMAIRQLRKPINSDTEVAWNHVKRFCEATGAKLDILRDALPTEITGG